MNIKISDHFDYSRLLRYALSPITMMLFCSIYSVVDGIFVANFVGKNPLAAINIAWPLIMIIGSFGFMLGTGGSAEIAKTYGEGKKELANEYFSNIVFSVIIVGILLSTFTLLNLKQLLYLCGATDLLLDDCLSYGRILLSFAPLFMLQNAFQTLSSTAERPKIGLICTVVAGISNIVFDYVFIVLFDLGVAGAAIGTASGYILGNIYPIIYFLRKNDSLFQFKVCKLYPLMILRSCYNGISEMVTNISGSVVCIIFNIWLVKLIGEDGVAAYSAMMYLDFMFKAIIIGYFVGMSPIIAYNFGAKNTDELKNVFRRSVIIVLISATIMFLIAEIGNGTISSLFDGGDPHLREILTSGFRIYSLVYIFCGIPMFASSVFTALCNGFLSALVSSIRTLILPVILINILAETAGITGVWITMPVAEFFTAFLSILLLIFNRKKYQY